jgi:hypothetical protein
MPPPNDPSPLTGSEASPATGTSLDTQPYAPLDTAALEAPPDQSYEHKQYQRRLVRFGLLGLCALLILSGILFILLRRSNYTNSQISNFPVTTVKLPDIPNPNLTDQEAPALRINGPLQANDSLILTPTTQPTGPALGQLYFDKATKQLFFYNGTGFASLGNIVTTTNNHYTTQLGDTIINQGNTSITNVTNITGDTAPAVLLQADGSSVVQDGSFNIAGAGQVGSLLVTGTSNLGSLSVTGDSTIQGSETVGGLQVLGSATIQGTAAIGSLTTSTISSPAAGNLTISTPAASAVSGSITIETGDSSTTASGDITIDTGNGVVDGTVVETKTFESGANNMVAWYGSNIAQSTATAHGGAESLAITAAGGNWGVNENQGVIPVHITPGHQYLFSLWVRAGSTSRSISGHFSWGGGATINFAPVTDTSSGWTQMSATGSAPADASTAYLTLTSTGASGEVHYLDDVSITDLSSASAASQISIGATNAKMVIIGNMNEIGPTTINGSSGITLNSGNASIQGNAGVIALNASAASSFTASRGALTLSAAATSSWGITQAVSGVGGDLTLHAGKGGAEANNNGGNLILQGGAANGSGTPGGVIVKPVTNSLAFQIQNTSGTSLLAVNTATMTLTVSGTLALSGHLVTGNTSGITTITAGPAACSAPTVSLTGNDTAGTITVTSGTGCTAPGTLATLTFAAAYGTAPHITLTPGNAMAAGLQYYRGVSTTTFSINTAITPTGSTTYVYDYQVMQ